MSSQNNWNNPDMYYQQERPQSGPVGAAPYAYGSNGVYAPASYGPGYPATGYQPLPPHNTLSIIGLVASIFGVTSSIFLGGIAGIIMGHMARKQIKQTGERGDGMALAALWIGYIGTAFWVLFWVVYVLIFVVLLGGSLLLAGTSGSVG